MNILVSPAKLKQPNNGASSANVQAGSSLKRFSSVASHSDGMQLKRWRGQVSTQTISASRLVLINRSAELVIESGIFRNYRLHPLGDLG
jgi:hypothetical protein